nr:MmcB family DNA repair protein [uncultured Capnocytophaga sp.]
MNIQNLRILSQIFSPPMFYKIIREDDTSSFQKKIDKHLRIKNQHYRNNTDIIKKIYAHLSDDYPCEYIYKNSLFLDIIKKYGLEDTVVLNEFRVGASKADLTMLNGEIKIYEIKTALDDFTKLAKQLADYQKIADKVYIVTSPKFSEKLFSEYKDSNIGICILQNKEELEEVKPAKSNIHYFDFATIFKTLRKPEYLSLVRECFTEIPDVPNTKIFRTCYNLLSQLNIEEFQKKVLKKLKERNISEYKLLISNKIPKELKYICNSLDLNKEEYQKMLNFLTINSLCTYHT